MIEKQYLHTGIPTAAIEPGMEYYAPLKVWIRYNADFDTEYLHWEPGTPMGPAGTRETHVAYLVGSVDEALALPGTEVILPPHDMGTQVIAYARVAAGPVVEWVQRK